MSPEDEEKQKHIRAAWLYFMEGLTQAEIAEILGTTRLRINRILSEARSTGLVSVSINTPLVSTVALERELIRDFGLHDALIIPTPIDPKTIQNLLGRAAASYVSQYLSRHKTTRLGIGWGGTLGELVNQLPVGNYSDMTVYSIMGGLTHGVEFNTFNIVSEAARKLGGQCEYLAAPIYASSPQSRQIILEQEVFRRAFEEIEKSDIIIVSVGDATEESLLISQGLPTDTDAKEIRAAGAVADVGGHFLNKDGKELDHPLNQRAITLSLEALSVIPARIFVAGGLHKVSAMSAVLRSGLASILICDEQTARKAAELAKL